jgi:hypothetical protein
VNDIKGTRAFEVAKEKKQVKKHAVANPIE